MKKTMLLAVLMMLGLAAGAYAQPGATFQGSTENVTTVVQSGHTELAGDIYFFVMQGSIASVNGTVTLKFNAPMTNPLDPIAIGYPQVTSVGTWSLPAAIDAVASDGPAGRLVIKVYSGGGPGNYIRVHGVRVDVAGNPKPQYTVTLSSTGNAIFNGQFTAPVIDGAAAGLKLDGDNSGSYKIRSLDTGALTGTPSLVLKEGFNSAYGNTDITDNTQTISQLIKIKLSAAPPKGVKIVFPAAVAATTVGGTASWTRSDADGDFQAGTETIDLDSDDLSIYYRLSSDNNPTLIESFKVQPTISVDKDQARPLPVTLITWTATLAKIEAAFDADGHVHGRDIPRYLEELVGPADLFIISGNLTNLLAPLAQNMPSIGYDTGLAIANTTWDPGKTAMGVTNAAIPQKGTICFYFYQQQDGATAPTVTKYCTSGSSPGSGLDADGNVPAGSTYVVLASELLTAAGVTAEFQGYIMMVCNFSNGHGLYVASNFTNFSQGSSMVVIGSDRRVYPESLGQ